MEPQTPATVAAQSGAALSTTDVTDRVDTTTRRAVNQLAPGDRIEVDHEIKVGLKRWRNVTTGTVVRIQRRRHGLHFKRSPDDKVFSDLIVLELADGSVSTLTIDEFTQLKRLS